MDQPMEDPQRLERIDELLQQALELDAEQRAAFLDAACDGDAELRREILDLLSRDVDTGDILKHSPASGLRRKAQADALRVGERISHYRVEARIGRGGMGEVWRAWDEQLKREVAIKILPLEFAADPERVLRFEQEAFTVSRLNHSNIVTIHDVGHVQNEHGDLHFIVTELIEGQTLRALLNQSRQGWREAVLIAAQIGSALNAAHSVGIIHRDIKPENVMALKNGHVKVLDFGIAKSGRREFEASLVQSNSFDLAPSLTAQGALLGTARYMSPEQARGEELDARADIFSIGLVLYEMIAGQHPYAGKSDEEIITALKSNEEIPPVSSVKARIPAALNHLIAKAIRKKREHRYVGVSEMQLDIEHLKSLIRLGSGEKEAQRLRARNADQLLTQYIVFHEADPKTRIPLGALWNITRFASLKRGLCERALIRKSLLRGVMKTGRFVLLIAALTMFAAAALSLHEEWAEQVIHDGHTAAARRAVFSPDGRLLVSVGEDKRVIVWDFAKRQRLATFNDHTERVTTVEFSPDGKWFVTASADGSIIVWDTARLAKAIVLPGQRGVVRSIVFSMDGRTLITPTNNDRKNIWEVGTWRKLREVEFEGYRYGQFLPSQDGRWLMAPYGDILDSVLGQVIADKRPYFWGGISPRGANTRAPFWSWAARAPDGRRIISIDAGGFVAFSETPQFEKPDLRKLTGHFRAHVDSGRAVAFSPDGKFAASGAEDIVLWDALAQKKLTRFKHPANVGSLAFSPNGNSLVSVHADGSILTWDTVERELVANFKEHHASIEAVAFARTGKRFATAGEDRSIFVWDVERGQKEAALLWHPVRITALAFSTDGQWLASNDLDGNLALWEVGTRQLRWSVSAIKRLPSEASYCVAISPDGRWMANSYGVYGTRDGRLVHDFRAEIPPTHLGFPQPTELRSLAFSTDGKKLVSVTARGDIAIRHTGEWRVIESQKLPGRHLVSVSLSSGGQMATGEDEGVVRLWQMQPLRQIAEVAHSSQVNAVAFSPDGREIVSACDDKTIILWNIAGERQLTRIGVHTAPIYAVAFSPNGKKLVSGGHDHSVRLYTRYRALWGWGWE